MGPGPALGCLAVGGLTALASLRRAAATWAGRAVRLASRALRAGAGTSLPGLVALRLWPDIVREVAGELAGCSVVTGTNGKTTTARMLAAVLRADGRQALHNRAGANLAGGVASALVGGLDWKGGLPGSRTVWGLFEVDEVALASLAPSLCPATLTITNLFRDQLDRYGEVDAVAALWRDLVAELGGTRLVLNADDPTLARLECAHSGKVLFYGIEDAAFEGKRPGVEADAKACPDCLSEYRYTAATYAHLGRYRCDLCGWTRPRPQVRAVRVEQRGLEGSELTIDSPAGSFQLSVGLPGLYNVYNVLAAVATGVALGVSPEAVRRGLGGFRAAFGRMERAEVRGRQLCLILCKNPAGFSEVVRTLVQTDGEKHLLIALNDLTADGRDVSWIWDVDFAPLLGRVATLVVSGTRAEEMALRLKYAGLVAASGSGSGEAARSAKVEKELGRALEESIGLTPPGEELYVLPTYTALLELRRLMAHRRYLPPYWED